MHTLMIVKVTLLIVSLSLGITAIATPEWNVVSAKSSVSGTSLKGKLTSGLFDACAEGSLNDSTASHCESLGSDVSSKIVACRALAITSVVLQSFALVINLYAMLGGHDSKLKEEIGAGLSGLGAVLMAICLGVFSTTDLIRDEAKLKADPKYGYSFYLALTSLLLSAGAAGISVTKVLNAR